MKVAIQGIKGSYHHQVAVEFFSDDIEIDECMSFDALIESMIENKSDYGVMAIENSIAGSIIPNYSLIDKYGLSIIGEHYININHNLMVYPGVKLNDVKYISSHPMALLQCKDFIKNSKNFPKKFNITEHSKDKKLNTLTLEPVQAQCLFLF